MTCYCCTRTLSLYSYFDSPYSNLTSAKPMGSKFLAVFSPAKLNGIGSGPSPPTMPLANSYSADDVNADTDDDDGGGANAVTGVIMAAMRRVVAESLVMAVEYGMFSGKRGSSSTRQKPRPNFTLQQPQFSPHYLYYHEVRCHHRHHHPCFTSSIGICLCPTFCLSNHCQEAYCIECRLG